MPEKRGMMECTVFSYVNFCIGNLFFRICNIRVVIGFLTSTKAVVVHLPSPRFDSGL